MFGTTANTCQVVKYKIDVANMARENGGAASQNSDGRPGADEARQALQTLGRDNADLAAKIITPWWYHPILGGIVAILVYSQAISGWVVRRYDDLLRKELVESAEVR